MCSIPQNIHGVLLFSVSVEKSFHSRTEKIRSFAQSLLKSIPIFSLADIFFFFRRAIMNDQGGISMKDRQTLQVSIHYSMAFIGGFFGAYALLNHCDIFGSSQTANLITLVTGLLGHNSHEILIRIGAALLYGLAIALSVVIPRTLGWDLKIMSIFVNGMAALMLFYIPAGTDHILALYPIFFATAFQWCAFKGVYGYSCSTIFSTNNFKQTVLGFTEYLYDKNAEALRKGKFFGGTLVFFHLGVVYSYFGHLWMGLHASMLLVIPLAVSFCLVETARREEKAQAAEAA